MYVVFVSVWHNTCAEERLHLQDQGGSNSTLVGVEEPRGEPIWTWRLVRMY